MDSIFGKQPENTSYVSFDEIENAFNTPTQRHDYYEPKPTPSPSDDDLGRLANPDGLAFVDPEPVSVETETVVDHDHAMRTGERIARLIDTGIDFTLSNFVARNGESYRADERDLQDIAEAWGEVSEEHNWNIGPEWTLAILYVMVYGPLVKQAVTDRRLAIVEERQNDQQAQIDMLKMQMADQAQQTPQPEKPASDGTAASPEPKPSSFTYNPQ